MMDDCKVYASYTSRGKSKEPDLKTLCDELKHKNARLEIRINKLEEALEGLKYTLNKLTSRE
jgi:chaperonin cofactor prefoldin